MTIELAKCTRCGRDMHPSDMAPLYASQVSQDLGIKPITPKVCCGCRIDLAQEALEAKQVFYGEERKA